MLQFTCPQLAEKTGYSRMQILRWARAGVIPGTALTKGRHFRFSDNPELRAWLRTNRKGTQARLWQKPVRRVSEGNFRFRPSRHHQNILAAFRRWKRDADLGFLQINEQDFAQDMRPLYEWLKKYYGD